MRNISFCVTCKDRLWQLQQTLPDNMNKLTAYDEIIILDYHSTDGLLEHLKDNYLEQLNTGVLKYFKITTPVYGFNMAYAKHIVHLLASRDVLFNLDADNFIGETINELRGLKEGQLLLPIPVEGTDTSRCGRIGCNKSDYYKIGGYDTRILGMSNDDGNFVKRAWNCGLNIVYSSDVSVPIQQDYNEKNKNVFKSILPSIVRVKNFKELQFDVNTQLNKVIPVTETPNEIARKYLRAK